MTISYLCKWAISAGLSVLGLPPPRRPWTRGPAGIVAWLLTTWGTFVPSCLFILLSARYVERQRGNQSLSAARPGITAAVVGVIANSASTLPSTPCAAPAAPSLQGPLHLELPDSATVRLVPVGHHRHSRGAHLRN
jgi:chromate transporter